jgi:hypothetical protein
MDPMPSGEAGGQVAREGAEAAGGVDGAGAEREVGAGAAAMDEPGRAAARQALGRARAGAEAAMHPAAAVRHGRLAAAAARTRNGAAARRLQEIARGVAIPEAAAGGTGGGVQLGFRRSRGGLGRHRIRHGCVEGDAGQAGPQQGGLLVAYTQPRKEAGHARRLLLSAKAQRRGPDRRVVADEAFDRRRTLHHEGVTRTQFLQERCLEH